MLTLPLGGTDRSNRDFRIIAAYRTRKECFDEVIEVMMGEILRVSKSV